MGGSDNRQPRIGLTSHAGGHIESAWRPLHAGRTVIVIETDVVDGEGRLVARVTQSQAVLRSG